ncbi:Uncharacterised protein [Vibrio cholerae]|nr:Uncharacterised protein [Vibrio cholerae]
MWLHHVAGALRDQRLKINTVDHIDRVKYVAFRLRHFVAVFVTDQTCYVHGFERNLRFTIFIFTEVHGHHDHARHPEEDDVKACNQNIGWVEDF